MIVEITVELSNVAAMYGGVEVVANPGEDAFTINLDWIEVAIAVTIWSYVSSKVFRNFLNPLFNMTVTGVKKLRTIEWRL